MATSNLYRRRSLQRAVGTQQSRVVYSRPTSSVYADLFNKIASERSWRRGGWVGVGVGESTAATQKPYKTYVARGGFTNLNSYCVGINVVYEVYLCLLPHDLNFSTAGSEGVELQGGPITIFEMAKSTEYV